MATNKKSNKRLYWILGGVLAVLLVAAVVKGSSKPKGLEVFVEKASKRIIREKVEGSGKIYPVEEVKISSDVSGEIVELLVKEGDQVKAGQLLARIDADAYQSGVERGSAAVNSSKAQSAQAAAAIKSAESQLAQMQAAVDQQEAQLENTRETHKRNEKLHKDGVISEAEFVASQSSLRAQEAALRASKSQLRASEASVEQARQSASAANFGVKSAEASLKELNTSLRRTSIYAPKSGTISKLSVEKGERVVGTMQMSGTELMRIANLSTMEVQVDVNENEVTRLKLGNETDIEVDAYPGRIFKGKVSEIANTASNALTATGQSALSSDQITNFVVKIIIDPASYQDLVASGNTMPFRPGMSASVSIYTNLVKDALSVPIQSVTTRDDEDETPKTDETGSKIIKTYVFVASADTVRMAEVKTGIQDDDHIQIVSGLKGDEEIVSGPYDAVARKLESGKKIHRSEDKDLKKGKKTKSGEVEID